MDDQGLIVQFETIETRLDALIQICKDKDNQNKELIRRIEKLEEELRTKVEAEHRYAEEKALIRDTCGSVADAPRRDHAGRQ